MELHPLNSVCTGGAGTCVCCQTCRVGFWLNTSASPECPEISWYSMIDQEVGLLFGKARTFAKCLFKCLAFGFHLD